MRATLIGLGAAIAMAAALAVPAAAHHNFLSQFDASKPVSLRGTLVSMDWINPHGWIQVDVTGDEGYVERWAIETANPARLEAAGLTRADFSPGADVLVVAFASRDGSTMAGGMTITFIDRQATYLIGR